MSHVPNDPYEHDDREIDRAARQRNQYVGGPPMSLGDDVDDLDIRDHLGQPMTSPDKFGYDGGYLVIDGKRYILIYREDAPEYPPFPCQSTGPESHPSHDWQGDWPSLPGGGTAPRWFRCPGWRGQRVNP